MKKRKDSLEFYNSVVTEEFVDSLLDAQGVVHRDGIFKASVVIWLMLSQRYNPNRSLAQAIEQLKLEADEFYLAERASGSIRARNKRIANSTGGYSRARDRIPLEVVKQVADRLAEAIEHALEKDKSSEALHPYVIDGSTVRIGHSSKNLQEYPPFKNQHGSVHFPLVRIGVATNAYTGIAIRPAFGPFSGEAATSEFTLAKDLLARLPKGSVALGDRYYGCFRFAYYAQRYGHSVLCRIKELNAKRFIGTPETTSGEKSIRWTPSPREQQQYPELEADASIDGKMVWGKISAPGFRPVKLILFTTLDLPPKKIIELYALRWNVELDLRHIKQTLGLEFINSRTPEIVAKELILTAAAYNLIRLSMNITAKMLRVNPRAISFTRMMQRLEILSRVMLSSKPDETKRKTLERALTDPGGLVPYKKKTETA